MQLSREPGQSMKGFVSPFEETGLYLVDAGEPLKDTEQDGDVIKVELYESRCISHKFVVSWSGLVAILSGQYLSYPPVANRPLLSCGGTYSV